MDPDSQPLAFSILIIIYSQALGYSIIGSATSEDALLAQKDMALIGIHGPMRIEVPMGTTITVPFSVQVENKGSETMEPTLGLSNVTPGLPGLPDTDRDGRVDAAEQSLDSSDEDLHETPESSFVPETCGDGIVDEGCPIFPSDDVPHGFDLFETDPGTTHFTFDGEFRIPAGFFERGSKPFRGAVKFSGVPLGSFKGYATGTADTIVERQEPADLHPPQIDMVDIELVALSLVSTEPLEVQVKGKTQLWDVRADVSPSRSSAGGMVIAKHDPMGGTFESQLTVFPLFRFIRQNDGNEKMLDTGMFGLRESGTEKLTFRNRGVPWVHTCPPGVLVVPRLNDNFCASGTIDEGVLTIEEAQAVSHGIRPARIFH